MAKRKYNHLLSLGLDLVGDDSELSLSKTGYWMDYMGNIHPFGLDADFIENGVVINRPDWIGDAATIRFPDGVVNFAQAGYTFFQDSLSLETVIFPDGFIGNMRSFPAAINFSSSSVSNIIFGAGILYFNGGAINNAYNLRYVKFPEGLKGISSGAFYGTNLSHVEIPESVDYIGAGALSGTYEKVVIKGTHTDLESGSFGAFSNVEILDIACASIADSVLASTGSLKSIIFREGVRAIGNYNVLASLIETVTIPSTVESIGSVSFCGNSQLREVICLGNTPPTLLEDSFLDNHPDFVIRVPNISLSAYKIAWSSHANKIVPIYSDGNVNSGYWIDSDGNVNSFSLNADFIENGIVVSRPSWAESAVTIKFPDGVINIINTSLSGFPLLETVIFPDGFIGDKGHMLPTLSFIDSPVKNIIFGTGILFFDDGAMNSAPSLEYIKFPPGLKHIGYGALELTNITEIEIPESVEFVGSGSFNRSPLKKVTIKGLKTAVYPNSFVQTNNSPVFSLDLACETIEDSFTNYFLNLKTAILREGAKHIKNSNFSNPTMKIETITLPTSMEIIENQCFKSIPSLREIILLSNVPPTLGSGCFINNHSDFVIRVPNISVDAYKTAWASLADIIVPMYLVESLSPIQSIVAGDGISIDTTDSKNPVISIKEKFYTAGIHSNGDTPGDDFAGYNLSEVRVDLIRMDPNMSGFVVCDSISYILTNGVGTFKVVVHDHRYNQENIPPYDNTVFGEVDFIWAENRYILNVPVKIYSNSIDVYYYRLQLFVKTEI